MMLISLLTMRQSCLLSVWLEYCWEAYLVLRDIFYVFIEESGHFLIFHIIPSLRFGEFRWWFLCSCWCGIYSVYDLNLYVVWGEGGVCVCFFVAGAVRVVYSVGLWVCDVVFPLFSCVLFVHMVWSEIWIFVVIGCMLYVVCLNVTVVSFILTLLWGVWFVCEWSCQHLFFFVLKK
jgi:hypothetical protein